MTRPSTIASERFLKAAREHEHAGRIDAAWACLEAAHIIGQRWTTRHVASHVAMLRLAVRTQHRHEIVGQMTRTLAAALFTWLWVPVGNSGRASVSALTTAPLPRDLAETLDRQQRTPTIES